MAAAAKIAARISIRFASVAGTGSPPIVCGFFLVLHRKNTPYCSVDSPDSTRIRGCCNFQRGAIAAKHNALPREFELTCIYLG